MDARQIVVDALMKTHRLSERDAASIALTVASVVKIEPLTMAAVDAGKCPFDEHTFELPHDVPCPVCGAFGDEDVFGQCVNYVK